MTRPSRPRAQRFEGAIAGVGTTSGVRLVVGRWHTSPLGSFADVMVATASGHRLLLAPSDEVASFVGATYHFDEVRVEPCEARLSTAGWRVRSDSLDLDLAVGGRTLLGTALRAVPPRLAGSPAWSTLTDPVARVVLRGVRTRGSAGSGRREYYGALDHHAVLAVSASLDGVDLGGLAPVSPPPDFGFSSTPARPSVTTVVSTVVLPR
ncbi:hypothetical protein [Nocardioides sp. GY 10127]|uniref:hypothetical protein n=1 Tax=Nocardioides sp. GY 10127 TaxID=2569762 RepID=UPI0010A82C7B|nr:hypothetical protein [Nocardioides sp. GY 10127]TIC82842.1 hypothetical protein E8D37_09245 [Nocardioides sp. GY 10127]